MFFVKNYIFLVLLVVIIVILLLTYLEYHQDLFKHRSQIGEIQSKVYQSKYGDIEYLLTGDGPTILISHGVTGGIDQGMGLVDAYIGQGYRFLFVSRFGYLKSSIPKEASAKLQATVYKDLLDYLKIDKIFIFGNSAGGPSSMNFAIDYPKKCQGLILLSTAVPTANTTLPPDFVFQSEFVYWLTTKFAGNALSKMFVPPTVYNKLTKLEKRNLVDEIFTSALPISLRSKGVLFDNHISTPSVNNISFEQINSPTLIIHAVDDPAPPISGAHEIYKKINNSKIVTFDGGHLILNHEKEIKDEIKKFIIGNIR